MVKEKIKSAAQKTAQKAKQKAMFVKAETKKHVGTAIAAAFAFLIALAWRDAIIDIINKIIQALGIEQNTYWLKILSAIIVTIIAVIGIAITAKITAKKHHEAKQAEKKA